MHPASHHAQVHGYRRLGSSSGLPFATWGGILQLRADGTYLLIEAEGGITDFERAVAAYRAAGKIDGKAGKARRARG